VTSIAGVFGITWSSGDGSEATPRKGTVTVANSVEEITAASVVPASGTVAFFDGGDYDDSATLPIALTAGTPVNIFFVVTAANGTTKMFYEVAVTRANLAARAIVITTPAPVRNATLNNGTAPAPTGTTGPTITWERQEAGGTWAPVTASGYTFAEATVYRTRYVFTLQAGYLFNTATPYQLSEISVNSTAGPTIPGVIGLSGGTDFNVVQGQILFAQVTWAATEGPPYELTASMGYTAAWKDASTITLTRSGGPATSYVDITSANGALFSTISTVAASIGANPGNNVPIPNVRFTTASSNHATSAPSMMTVTGNVTFTADPGLMFMILEDGITVTTSVTLANPIMTGRNFTLNLSGLAAGSVRVDSLTPSTPTITVTANAETMLADTLVGNAAIGDITTGTADNGRVYKAATNSGITPVTLAKSGDNGFSFSLSSAGTPANANITVAAWTG
jgi:hypothetical protein